MYFLKALCSALHPPPNAQRMGWGGQLTLAVESRGLQGRRVSALESEKSRGLETAERGGWRRALNGNTGPLCSAPPFVDQVHRRDVMHVTSARTW